MGGHPPGVARLLMVRLTLASLLLVPSVALSVEVGEQAPDFTLPGSDGQSYHLRDFRGKRAVVLAWFPKAFTGG